MTIFKSARLNERAIGIEAIERLKKTKGKTLVIHYSCESFFNLNGRTPRVTSICVKNRGNNTVKTFSIHLQAQFHKKDLCNLTDQDYDFLEKSMLKDFSDFVKKHLTYNWVHWNMRNSSYGFEAISNRFRILGGHLKEIEDQFKYDLPEIIGSLYTYKFEKHKPNGQLLNLSKRNRISDRDVLVGKDEATCFENSEFLMLHMSTCRKVEIIDRLLSLEEKKQLKVNVSVIDIYGLTPLGLFEIIRNNWLLFAIWSLAIGILGAVLEPVFQSIFGTSNYGK